MRATEKDVQPGAILYYVSCISAADKNPHIMAKVLVTSKVNTENNTAEKWFLCEDDYRSYGSDWLHKDSHHFLGDCGIGGDYRCNLHRLFTTESSAAAYVEECKAGVFSDPLDQAFYDLDEGCEYDDIDWDLPDED